MAAFNLRVHRLNAGLSPEALGRLIDVAGQTIRNLEEGKTPTPAVAKKIADFVGKPVVELYPDLGKKEVA